jgi:hypothetical protein
MTRAWPYFKFLIGISDNKYMKKNRLGFLISLCFVSSSHILAQDDKLTTAASNVIDVLAQTPLQKSTENAKELSNLEDLNENSCVEDSPQIDEHPSCLGMAESLLPSGYKEKNWRTLLEIKYQNISPVVQNVAKKSEGGEDLWHYRQENSSQPLTVLNSQKDLENEAQKISDWYKTARGQNVSVDQIKPTLIMEQITNSNFYQGLSVDEANKVMFNRLGEITKSLNDDEFLNLMSMAAELAPYNRSREAFQQKEGGGYGLVTPFEQLTALAPGGGICGDIHSMVAKMGETRGWEAFTVGYAVSGSQHVVTAMVNPKEPDKLMIVNYKTYEKIDLNNGDWINPTPQTSPGFTSYNELGSQLRIFKNNKTGDPLGKMQQIATIPTALGSFMNDLFKKQNQISKAMTANNNYIVQKQTFERNRHKVESAENGNQIVDKLAGEGLVVYQGKTNNANIYGVAVSHDVYKTLYRWDPKEGKCVPKKNKYFSVGLANSLVTLPEPGFVNAYYAYLNMKGGQIFHVYQTEYFQFKGIIGYELEAFGTNAEGLFSGDGNFTTLMGVIADYNKKGLKVHTGLKVESNLGLRDQGLMTDFRTIPTNLNPISFNAVSLDVNLSQQITPKTSFVTNNNITMSRVGGYVVLSTGIITGNTSIMASYQGGVKALPIGNSLQQVNLLQNYNNMDGFRITAGHNFSNKSGTFSGNVSGYAGVSTSTPKGSPIGGVSLKANISGKKKTEKPKDF